MGRGRLFSALVAAAISISVPGAALAGCMAGPSDAPMAQMACCKNGHHECHKSGAAGDCCKTKHQQDQRSLGQQNLAKASSLVKFSPAAGRIAVAVSPTTIATDHSRAFSLPPIPLFAGTSSPPRFAFSVLLI